jgi:hypothetical protein
MPTSSTSRPAFIRITDGKVHDVNILDEILPEAGWEEWKTEKEPRRLNLRNPNRYAAGSDEPWRCPPRQAYAERLGLYYRVRSSAEINWVFQRNVQFMEDYLRADLTAIAAGSRDIVIAYVSANPGLTLNSLTSAT